jgi:hypothetical protein
MFNVPLVPVHGLSECAKDCRGAVEKTDFLSHDAIQKKLSRFCIVVHAPVTLYRTYEDACSGLAEQHATGHLILVAHREGIRIFSPSERLRKLPYCAIVECEYDHAEQRVLVPETGLIHPPAIVRTKK